MFEISVKGHFSAAHRLVGYDGSCARPHGHNWEVEVFVRGSEPDALGLLLDFRDVKRALADVLAELDHQDLNGLPAFVGRNPSSEHLAHHLYDALSSRLNGPRCRVTRVAVSETPGSRASYWDDGHG
jgi:6-pyruvoyltetrahydropterin/6-carboxytetrahydropterin synthase